MVNLNVVYHLTDTLNLGVFGGFTALQSETDLHSKVDTVLRRDDPDRLQRLGYSHTQWLAGFEFGFVPVFGKFMLFNSTALHYDIHLLGGVSYVNRKAEPAVDNGVPSDPVLSGTRPSPTLGVGSRLYISDGMALNLQFRDYIYSETPLSVGNGESTLSQNYTLSLGLSFFLPGEPEISR
jgi:outer membrane beta-barrel protein